MLALALLLSIAGLAVGPALVALHRGRAAPSAAVEGLTLGLVPALVLVRLVPHVYRELGPAALGLVALGYLALWLADRRSHRAGARVGRAIVVPTLVAHALTDGAGLALAASSAQGSASAGALLGLALVLHRLPEGLFLASTLAPELGWRRTFARLGALAGATIAGALAGQSLLARVPDALFDAVVAVGLGAMLRLVSHTHAPSPRTPASRAAAGTAFALGVALALAIPAPDSVLRRAQPSELSLMQSLGPLFVETAPSMLLGLIAAGLFHAYVPRRPSTWLRGDSPLSQALRGLAFGLPLPICSCGVLPLTRRLLVAGAPTAAVVAFAVATPELGLDSAALSLRLLGLPLTTLRLVASTLVALAAAFTVTRAAPRFRLRTSAARSLVLRPTALLIEPEEPLPPSSAGDRLRAALSEALGPALDHTAAWYVAGLVLAAAFEAGISPTLAARVGAPADVALSALAAVPLYVCAQGATPLAAVMVHKGFSVGAALAFAIVGPATNLAVIGVLRRALGARAAMVFALTSLVAAVSAGLAANALVPARTVPAMHPLVAHEHHVFEWACAALLGALLVRSLLRLGPRAWLGNMAADTDADAHAHGLMPASEAQSRSAA